MNQVRINHVMSQDIPSNILTSFIGYLQQSDRNHSHEVSIEPIDGCDVYHYHRPHLEKKLKKNSIVTVHHDLEESDPWLSLMSFINRYKECSKVVCLNNIQKKILEDYNIDNTIVIPHGYNKTIFKREPREFQNKKITLGLISKRYGRRVKGEAYFYDLVKRLDQDLFDFIFVGEGRSIEHQFVKSLGFDSKVFERLPYRIFGDLYKKIDLLLMLSLYEGGPANIPEAVISNVPVAAFNIGMVPDFISDGTNGLILTGDADVDAKNILNLALEDNSYEKLLASTCEYNKFVPSWEEVAELYSQVYNEVALI
ncbi:glycosyltransferase family 4 protein [Vibrio cholerae]|uniref:glycosyltransferase family 4 protein n=2 Tax=Vibrio cholerae TaxID=666 RepID=UPI000BA93400|nr:glycosyltransferase family 4 protein [Vibrio cholerae]MCX9439168.1 glycosyltransferase family 4 protein [Vibrio cholerae]PAS02684.1 glycosyl transferase [Vibrio cholerae]TQQ19991.1 glycosyltransferase family 4 protein [Vibrio cholerae]